MPSEIHFYRGIDRHVGRAEENMNCCPSRTRLDSLHGGVLRTVRGMAMVFAMLIGVAFLAAAGWAQSGAAQAGQNRGGNAVAGGSGARRRQRRDRSSARAGERQPAGGRGREYHRADGQ